MSVSSQLTSVSYVSDGSTTAWAIPFYFMAVTDFIVQINTGGVVTTPVYNTAYSIAGTPNSYGAYPNGGTLTWASGFVPANGATFVITRNTARLQPDKYTDNSPFPATVNESDLDRLTLIAQELASGASGFIGNLMAPPTTGTYAQGNWFIVIPPVPGQYWGYVCTTAGSPGVWKPFGPISL